jgi:hypothetical protein
MLFVQLEGLVVIGGGDRNFIFGGVFFMQWWYRN